MPLLQGPHLENQSQLALVSITRDPCRKGKPQAGRTLGLESEDPALSPPALLFVDSGALTSPQSLTSVSPFPPGTESHPPHLIGWSGGQRRAPT